MHATITNVVQQIEREALRPTPERMNELADVTLPASAGLERRPAQCAARGISQRTLEIRELHMKTMLSWIAFCALAVTLMAPLAQAQQQAAGLQAAFGEDAGTLSEKFTGLARVMSDKYDWKPGEGVRSVGDVFNLIVFENRLLAGVLSGSPNAGARPQPITDPERMQEALEASYANLQKAITGLSDSDLRTTVKLFGRDRTKQDAVMFVLLDQHEHLGQSIAYARTNGVVPPWSK
jgi:uncharacterized damage-inducible protein DinB